LTGFVRYAVPLAGLIGAALYVVLRLSYVFFYLQLRATPEAVGYGYVEILAGQLVRALELVVVVSALFFCAALLLRVALLQMARLRGRGRTRFRTTPISGLPSFAVRTSAVALGIVLFGLPIVAWAHGSVAVQGFTVRNVYLAGSIPLPVLAVAAVPVVVTEVGAESGRQATIGNRPCLLYLGSANGQAVFYDVVSHESSRIPTSSIVIALQNTESVPDGC
jgi:hypothetical protein